MAGVVAHGQCGILVPGPRENKAEPIYKLSCMSVLTCLGGLSEVLMQGIYLPFTELKLMQGALFKNTGSPTNSPLTPGAKD